MFFKSQLLRIWIRQQEPVDNEQDALTVSKRQRLKELEREARDLRRSNDILCQASATAEASAATKLSA